MKGKKKAKKSSRHHHESCTTLLHTWSVAARPQVVLWWGRSTSRVSIAVLLSGNFEVVIAQYNTTGRTCKASRVKLAASVDFQILALDAAITATADGPVELVVMTFAVWRVVEDVELCCWERIAACSADEALLVVPPSNATRGVFDGFSNNGLGASTTFAFTCGSSVLSARSCLRRWSSRARSRNRSWRLS